MEVGVMGAGDETFFQCQSAAALSLFFFLHIQMFISCCSDNSIRDLLKPYEIAPHACERSQLITQNRIRWVKKKEKRKSSMERRRVRHQRESEEKVCWWNINHRPGSLPSLEHTQEALSIYKTNKHPVNASAGPVINCIVPVQWNTP